jgi:hypothetical protein
MILPPFDDFGPQFDHGKLMRIYRSMYSPDWFDQVNAIGIFYPDSSALRHKVVVCFKTHTPTFGWRAIGHAPQQPAFFSGFTSALIQFVIVIQL